MTPYNATKKGNHFEVAMNLNTNKRHDRVYEPLKVSDKVKIARKVKLKKSNRPACGQTTPTPSTRSRRS